MGPSSPSSPLRYPGGKQCLAPFVGALIEGNGLHGCSYAEPYAGGAGLALRLLLDGVVEGVLLNDKCSLVSTFWQVLFGQTEDLLRRVADTPVSMEVWRQTREVTQHYREFEPVDVAFALFFQNRTNFSGVIDGGVIGGKAQGGKYKLDARYPKGRLLALMGKVAALRDQVKVFNMDALNFMRSHVLSLGNKCFTYCDPPYFVKGQGLYLNAYQPQDHQQVASFLLGCPPEVRWMVSYDNVPEIVGMYKAARLFSFDLPYSAHVKRQGKELLALGPGVVLPKDARELVPLVAVGDACDSACAR